jgi:hypothetical protein
MGIGEATNNEDKVFVVFQELKLLSKITRKTITLIVYSSLIINDLRLKGGNSPLALIKFPHQNFIIMKKFKLIYLHHVCQTNNSTSHERENK